MMAATSSLDSRCVSRFQNLFLETPEGWMLIDLIASTNGCFVNRETNSGAPLAR